MEISPCDVESYLKNDLEVWFFITKYSCMATNLTICIEPKRLGKLEFYDSINVPYKVYPMGKRGKPLSKSYFCSEVIRSYGGRFDEKVFVKFHSSYEESILAYNAEIEKAMREVSKASASRKAYLDRTILDLNRKKVRDL